MGVESALPVRKVESSKPDEIKPMNWIGQGLVSSVLPLLVTGAEAVGRGPRVREVGSSIHDRVKPMTGKIDTCFLVWHSLLIEYSVSG